MAESFQSVSLSLGEAERMKNGHQWTTDDYDKHSKKNYHIDSDRTSLNKVLVSANGLNERQLVNKYFEKYMLDVNNKVKAKVAKYNADKAGKINPKTGKSYSKKSVDKRQVYPVGEFAGKGKRTMPYDQFKQYIEQGNVREKTGTESRFRTSVLQQYIVGFGNTDEWKTDDVRKLIKQNIKMGGKPARIATDMFTEHYAKPFLKQFEKENPSLHIVQAVVQFDETNPHLHLTVLPHVEKATRNGLGSVGYTTAIAHDHPDFKDRHNTIDKFYRLQHANIKQIITDATPFVKLSNKFNKSAKMTVGKPMKRQSKQPMRVNQFAKLKSMEYDQLKWVADQQKKLNNQQKTLDQQKADNANQQSQFNKEENETKDDYIDTIKGLYPSHQVPSSKLSEGETAEPIDSPTGTEQHRRQRLTWLRMITIKLIQRTKEELETRIGNINKREAELKKANDKATKQAKKLSKREIDAKDKEGILTNKEGRLNHKETQLQNREVKLQTREQNVVTREQKVTEGEQQNSAEKRRLSDFNEVATNKLNKATEIEQRNLKLKGELDKQQSTLNAQNQSVEDTLRRGFKLLLPDERQHTINQLAKGQMSYGDRKDLKGLALFVHQSDIFLNKIPRNEPIQKRQDSVRDIQKDLFKQIDDASKPKPPKPTGSGTDFNLDL